MRSITLAITAVSLLFSPWITNHAIGSDAEQQICDVDADYSLGVEDYPEAIRQHLEVLRNRPDNALAHYHLGFALGMVGDRTAEVREYQRAEALGLKSWDLFLNLGLAKLEIGDLGGAADSFRLAVFLGEGHSESHFNLAIVEDRRGMLADAEHETFAALHLSSPAAPDVRNLLGVIYAQEGKTASASQVWRDLVRDVPDYEPARENLAILGSSGQVANGGTAAVSLPRAVAVHAIAGSCELWLATGKAQSQ